MGVPTTAAALGPGYDRGTIAHTELQPIVCEVDFANSIADAETQTMATEPSWLQTRWTWQEVAQWSTWSTAWSRSRVHPPPLQVFADRGTLLLGREW